MAPLVDSLASDIDYDHHNDAVQQKLQYIDESSTTTTCSQGIIPHVSLSYSITSRPQHQPRPKKHVSFATYSELYYVPHVNDMTDQEYEDTYMTDDDYCRIRNDMKQAIVMMERLQATSPQCKSDIEQDCYNFRGLENATPYGKFSKRQRIAFFREAVFQEQEMHGQLSPEWVAEYLATMAIPYAHAAHIMGVYDYQCSTFLQQDQ